MAIGTDFEIQLDKDIRYIGADHGLVGAGYYTVIELHRWLQSLADDASASGDDYMDITEDTPTDRSTDNIITMLNGYNIDQAASEHLYGGSIIQAAGDDIWDGILVYANPGMDMQIIQDGALVADPFWNEVPFGTGLKGLNPDAANGISHRFMLKVRDAGADIDGRRIITQTREWGKTFSEFKINGTSRGNNVSALTFADDLNNTTAVVTVDTWSDITNENEGYNLLNVDGLGDAAFYSEWNRDIYSINQFYERMKAITRRGTIVDLYGLNGDIFRGITHQITIDNPTGTFDPYERVTWAGGTGQMLAIDDDEAGTKMWIQLLTGVAPTNGQTITGVSTATADVNVTVTERTLSFPFCGVSTGSALIGSYGLGVEVADLSASDKVFDLNNVQHQAPNFVTFTVGNLVAGDRVLVGPEDGGSLEVDQLLLDGALSGAAVTAVVVTTVIPADTPATGTIRILRVSGFYTRHAYTSWTNKTFNIPATDFSSDNAANGADTYISYIDGASGGASMSFTSIYSADRDLYVRVRNGGGTPKIKTYETTAVLGSAGGTVTTSRISDE